MRWNWDSFYMGVITGFMLLIAVIGLEAALKWLEVAK
jgi:hypothetical protein